MLEVQQKEKNEKIIAPCATQSSQPCGNTLLPGKALRKVEGPLALFDGDVEPGAHDVDVAVVGHLEVIDAGHDGGEEFVRGVRGLGGFADDGEHGRESLETCVEECQ